MAKIKIDGSRLVHENLVLVGNSVNPLQPPTITVDGTSIPNPWLNNFLPIGTNLSNGGDWYVNGNLDFTLLDGTYTIVVQSANFSVITFSVADGVLNYDSSIDTLVEGRGTNTLLLKGVNITIDASYIIGRGLILGGVWNDFKAKIQGYFLPNLAGHKYSFIVGSGLVADFMFNINISGKIIFDNKYSGYSSGNNTDTLTLYGYPILVDARDTISSPFEVIGPWDRTLVDNHNPSSASKVVMGNFMPLLSDISQYLYGLQIDTLGHQTGFHLSSKGRVTLNTGAGFRQDKFNKITRIIIC